MKDLAAAPFGAEIERLERIANDLALPGRQSAVRAELYHAIARRLRRLDARAPSKVQARRPRQSAA
jgi:hypothetical protein